jgi:predicted RNase H-like nuclease (RuvC/YqgF family)
MNRVEAKRCFDKILIAYERKVQKLQKELQEKTNKIEAALREIRRLKGTLDE